jgi:hypothetical protein
MDIARMLLIEELASDPISSETIEPDTCVCSACPSDLYDTDGFCLDDDVDSDIHIDDTVEGGWGHYVKLVVIGLKVIWLIYSCTRAMLAYKRKDGTMCNIPAMIFAVCILCKITLLTMDIIGAKYIAGFFMGTFFVNYLNFIGLMYILRNLDSKSKVEVTQDGKTEIKEINEGEHLKLRTRTYFIIMNCLYAFVAGTAIFWLRPVCRDQKVYPYVFNWSAMLFFLNAIYHYIIHSMDYGLTWFHVTLDA